MTATILFEFPLGWLLAVPAAAGLAFAAWRQNQRGLARPRILALLALRALPLLLLLFLVARPVWSARQPPASAARSVVLLMDRSESMSLEDRDGTRYQQALAFLRDRLLPEFKAANLPVQAILFDQGAEPADGSKLASTTPTGKRTNLGGAIAQAVTSAAQPPLAVLALTDGIANETADNARALSALADSGVPFIGVGFGSDQGVRTLSLREVEAPSTVSPKTAFSISAQLEIVNADELRSTCCCSATDNSTRRKAFLPAKARGPGLKTLS